MLFVQVPNPASVAFLILLHVRCISNAILLCSPSLSFLLFSGLLFALRKLKRNYYNLYYLQLSCPSELAQLPRLPPHRLWRNAKVSSALGQEVTRAAPASASCSCSCSSSCSSSCILLLADVVCFVVVAAWPKVQKCMQTTCGNVEIYSYQVTIATVDHAWRWNTLRLTLHYTIFNSWQKSYFTRSSILTSIQYIKNKPSLLEINLFSKNITYFVEN